MSRPLRIRLSAIFSMSFLTTVFSLWQNYYLIHPNDGILDILASDIEASFPFSSFMQVSEAESSLVGTVGLGVTGHPMRWDAVYSSKSVLNREIIIISSLKYCCKLQLSLVYQGQIMIRR